MLLRETLIPYWELIYFSSLKDGRLFEVGANSRLGAYSNKYGNYEMVRDDVKQKMPEGTAWVDFVTFTAPLYFYCCAFRLFSDIL